MAVFRNVMAFLGLDDDDQMYDDEAFYDDEPEVTSRSTDRNRTIALDDRVAEPSFGFSADAEMNETGGGVGAVRPLRPVPEDSSPVPDALSGNERRTNLPDTAGAFEVQALEEVEIAPATPTPEPVLTAPVVDLSNGVANGRPPLTAIDGTGSSASRAQTSPPVEETKSDVVTYAKPRLHIPSSFDDASRIADDFRVNSPVVMNLTKIEKPVARRLIDFASGVCYVLDGGMERVAPNVYLLTPSGVDVNADDRRRMQERGYDR